MFLSFFTTIFRGSSAVLCAVTIPPADLRSLSLYYYVVCGRMCMSSACVWCSCLLVIILFTSYSRYYSSRWFAFVEFVLLRIMWPHVCHLCVFGVLVCWWSACSQADHQQTRSPTDKNTKHAQMTYTCGHILRNNTNSKPRSLTPILILSSHLRLCIPSGLFPSAFPTKILYTPFSLPYVPHTQPILFCNRLSGKISI